MASGLATKLTAGDGSARYDARSDHHYHLRCLRSGAVQDLPTPFDPDLIDKLDPDLMHDLAASGLPRHRLPLELVGYFEAPTAPRGAEAMSRRATVACPPLVDTHAHLDDPALASDLDRGPRPGAGRAGSSRSWRSAPTADDSASVVAMAGTTGVSSPPSASTPTTRPRPGRATGNAWSSWPADPRVVAIGETGLDRYWDRHPVRAPAGMVRPPPRPGHERGLPVVIHCRDCERDIIDQLARLGRPVRGVLHSFTGDLGRRPRLPRPRPPPLVRGDDHLHQQERSTRSAPRPPASRSTGSWSRPTAPT